MMRECLACARGKRRSAGAYVKRAVLGTRSKAEWLGPTFDGAALQSGVLLGTWVEALRCVGENE